MKGYSVAQGFMFSDYNSMYENSFSVYYTTVLSNSHRSLTPEPKSFYFIIVNHGKTLMLYFLLSTDG